MVTVETDKMQLIVGHLRQRYDLSHLAVDLKNDFAAVILTSLDGKTLALANEILLNMASSVSNTGMKWNQDKTSLLSWGSKPTQIDPLSGTVIVRGLREAEAVEVIPLDRRGELLEESLSALQREGAWNIDLEGATVPWYLLRVIRRD